LITETTQQASVRRWWEWKASVEDRRHSVAGN